MYTVVNASKHLNKADYVATLTKEDLIKQPWSVHLEEKWHEHHI